MALMFRYALIAIAKRLLGGSGRILVVLFTAISITSLAHSTELSDNVVKIGVLTDMSGVYSDQNGEGSVVAAQLAIEDFGGTVLGRPIILISADHQQKTDVG